MTTLTEHQKELAARDQCCGNCKLWNRLQAEEAYDNDGFGECLWECAMPDSVCSEIEKDLVRESHGSRCPTFEPIEHGRSADA